MTWFGGSPSVDRLVDCIVSRASAAKISELLNGLDPVERVKAVAAAKRSLLGQLFDLVAGGQRLELVDMVPAGTPAGATVTFEGRNSLPVFSGFQKRFTRTADGLVFGYNNQSLRVAGAVTGPGYFVVADGGDDHQGELLFDYTKPPPFEPPGWPAYRPNDSGVSRFVFMDLHDYVRKVADGVVVGKAFKRSVDLNTYFSLTAVRV